ncbi:ATP-binding protein [Desulfofustis limnaeus]|nr:hypothetical protein [Desulfofustis limnaeus]
MTRETERMLSLRIPAEAAFIPTAMTFADTAARGLGLDDRSARTLMLATEEVAAYLCRIGLHGHAIAIECIGGGYFIEIRITLPVSHLQLRAFNLTARLDLNDETDLDQMGLLLASRMTDRFHITRSEAGHLILHLIKEYSYPEIADDQLEEIPATGDQFRVEVADPARIKWLARSVVRHYPSTHYPPSFRYPGKITDMVAAGACQVLVAVGPGGELLGGLAWQWIGDKTVELFGVYLLHHRHRPEIAGELLETCLNSIARTSALALLCRNPTEAVPDGYLEALTAPDVQPTALFRLLYEETGAVVWSHPELVDFLRKEYRRLFLPRDIQTVTDDGETREPHSVLSCEIDRHRRAATLRPLLPGTDCRDNLAEHLSLFAREQLQSIYLELDLGHAWQAVFVPAALQLGFVPRLILPHAGQADLVVFELVAGA